MDRAPMQPPQRTRDPYLRGLTAVALLACLLSLTQALAGARLMDYTYDEPFHLGWARRLVFAGETERRSITNFDSKTPVTAVNVLARVAARSLGVRDSSWLRFSARLPGVGWLAGLFLAVFLIARRHLGVTAALVALTLVAADPNLPAHAGLVTVDVVYALASLLMLAAAMAAYQRPSVVRCLLLALAFAFACTAKFTGILLVPVLALPLLRLLPRLTPDRAARARLARTLLVGGLAGAVAFVLLVSATYGFIKMGRPLGEQPWSSGPMTTLARLLPQVGLPLPNDFLSGIDICLGKEREKQIMVGILQHRDVGPVPYYFLASWLFKTPVLLLVAQVAGLLFLVRRGPRWMIAPGVAAIHESPLLRADGFLRLLALSLVLNLLYLSFIFRYQIGYRYAFMCLPLLAILASAGLARRLSVRLLGYGALALVITGAIEQLPYVGNGVAFSNALVQPKRRAFRLLGHDSNLDYGQHREQAPRWISESRWARAPFNPIHPLPGPNVFAVADLGHPRQTYWLARIDPIAHLHHTVLVFDVDARQFSDYLAAARSPEPGPQDAGACGTAPVVTVPLDGEFSLPDGDATLCFTVTQPTDLALTGVAGAAHFGPVGVPRRLWDAMEPGAQAWYRLRPGQHVFGSMRAQDFRGRWHSTGLAPAWRVAPGWRLSP
jgi:hypothetical protein